MNKDRNTSGEMTFFGHLDALRPHLVRGVLAVAVFMIAALLLKKFIIDTILMGPQSPDFATNRLLDWLAGITDFDFLTLNPVPLEIINTRLGGQFNLHMKVSALTGIVIAVPYIMWELWSFVKPALTPPELRGSRLFVFYVSLCFFAGLFFGYFVIAPITVNFLANYTASGMITNLFDIMSYLNTVMNVSFAGALVFQLPVLIYFLAKMGLLTSAFMRKYRRHSLVVLMVFAAIITPPDIISLLLVTVPLYALYEYGIRIAARVERKREPGSNNGLTQ